MDWIARMLGAAQGREDGMAGDAALAGPGMERGPEAGAQDRFDRLAEAVARMQRPAVAVFRRDR